MVSYATVNVPSRISDPPSNIQLNEINLSSNKFMVRADYQIKASTSDGSDINLNRQTKIAAIISFPSEYNAVLNRI